MASDDLIQKMKSLVLWPFPADPSTEEILAEKITGPIFPNENTGGEVEDDIRYKAAELGATKIANYHRREDISPIPGPFWMYEGVPVRKKG